MRNAIIRAYDGSVLNAHISAVSDAHQASAIGFDGDISGLTADNVQDAVDEVVELVNQSLIQPVDHIEFSQTPVGVCDIASMQWNPDYGTLEVGMPGGNVCLQIGQENLLRCRNSSGVTIPNGASVFVSGSTGQTPQITLADASSSDTSDMIGVATETIADNAFGYVCTFGLVRGIDTSAFSEGQEIWLSTVSGEFTATRPTAPNIGVKVGFVIYSHAVNGIILVNVNNIPKLSELSDVAADLALGNGLVYNPANSRWETSPLSNSGFYTGECYVTTTDVTVTYSRTNRTMTLTGDFEAYYKGVKVPELTTGWVSAAHTDDTSPVWFLYYDGSGFHWSNNYADWRFDNLLIAIALRVWDGSQYVRIGLREPHGKEMSCASHENTHEQFGTYRQSGGGVTGIVLNSTTAANRRPQVATSYIVDEDIVSTVASTTGNYTQFKLAGASALATFTLAQDDMIRLSTNQPYYNQNNAGTWQDTLFPVNAYGKIFVYDIPVTADSDSQSFRRIFVMPQTVGTSLPVIQAVQPASINFGTLAGLIPEIVCIHSFIVRFTAANWVVVESAVVTGNRNNQVSNTATQGLTSVAVDANDFDGNGTIATPLAIRNIGDGKTYGNKDGVWTEIAGGGEWSVIETVTISTATASVLFDGLTTGKDYRVRWKNVDITGDGLVRTTFRESGTARNQNQIRQTFYPTSLGSNNTSGSTYIDWSYDQYLVGATGEGFIILHNTNQTNAWCEGKGYQKHSNTGYGGQILISTAPQTDGQKINELLFSSAGSTFAAGTFILEEYNG